MNIQGATKRYFVTGNKTSENAQVYNLGHVLEAKRKERRLIQHDQKQIIGKLKKLEQSQNKTMNDLDKKYQQLQNIYKIRIRKQTQQGQKQRLKKQKEDLVRLVKTQCREERQKNASIKKESLQTLLENNRKLFLAEKNSKRRQQLYRHEGQKKVISKNMTKTIQMKESKQVNSNVQIEHRRFSNKQSIQYFRSKLSEQQHRKAKNIQRIKSLSQKHTSRRLQHQKNIAAKVHLDSILMRAHQINLMQLEQQIMKNKPLIKPPQVEKIKPVNLMRCSKSKFRSKRRQSQLFNKTAEIELIDQIDQNPEEPQIKRIVTMQFNSLSNIQDTIRAIQLIELQQFSDVIHKQKYQKDQTQYKKKALA